jgi:hypothetical protein
MAPRQQTRSKQRRRVVARNIEAAIHSGFFRSERDFAVRRFEYVEFWQDNDEIIEARAAK